MTITRATWLTIKWTTIGVAVAFWLVPLLVIGALLVLLAWPLRWM